MFSGQCTILWNYFDETKIFHLIEYSYKYKLLIHAEAFFKNLVLSL